MCNVVYVKSRRRLALVHQPTGIIHAIHVSLAAIVRANHLMPTVLTVRRRSVNVGLLLMVFLLRVGRPCYARAWTEPALRARHHFRKTMGQGSINK